MAIETPARLRLRRCSPRGLSRSAKVRVPQPDRGLARVDGEDRIETFVRTSNAPGKSLDELRAKIPPGVLELTRVPGLGPKRALQLNRDLGVQSVDDLAAAIKASTAAAARSSSASSSRRRHRPR